MDLLRSVYGALSTVVTGPRKRRPGQVFQTKGANNDVELARALETDNHRGLDDVHRLLLSECLRRVSDEQINALKEAFEARAAGERRK